MFIVVFSIPLFGQNTFSKIYDVDTNAIRNQIRDFTVIDNHLFTYSATYCPFISDSLYRSCISLTKYDLQGNIIKNITLDSLDATDCCDEGLTTDGENLFLSTYLWGNFYIPGGYDKITAIDFDNDLEQLDVYKYDEELVTSSALINSGIEVIGNYRYLYGKISNPFGIPDSVHIVKIDLDGNELDRFYYTYGDTRIYINNLQATYDGNLAFIMQIRGKRPGINNTFDGYQLTKIDTMGNILDTFVFKDSYKQPNRILSLSNGGYVFSSIDHPITGLDLFTTGYGLINKMNATMDSLDWSLTLPNNQLVDGRHYSMSDYIEAANGDIIACGNAFDSTDTELDTGVADKNSTWSGFIVRLTPDGEIRWLRLYKNDNYLLPHNEYGKFRPSRLHKIVELPDGRFVAAGDVYVTSTQLSAIDEFETEAFHLWLLMVDENGCLEGYDCEEIIRLNQNASSDYSLGDEWIYEEESYYGGGNSKTSYKSVTIQDTLFDGTHTNYVLGAQGTFYVEDSKMYFWDEHYQEFVMYYDWESTTSYDIKYYDPFRQSDEMATVIIDSITYRHFGNDSLRVQHVHIENSGTYEDGYNEVVYQGVGASSRGVKFILGCGLCDHSSYITVLRCFKNDSKTYQFVPYACDSTWLTSSIKEVDEDKVQIYPNPTRDKVYISGIDTDIEYELFTSSGHLVTKGITEEKMINLVSSGLFIIKLKIDNNWIVKRVVKME